MNGEFIDSDLVLSKDGNGEIQAAGYRLKSFSSGGNLMKTVSNDDNQKGGDSFQLALNNLAVPAGLFYLQQNLKANSEPTRVLNKKNKNTGTSKTNYECHNVISEGLFESLLAMVEPGERKMVDIKTRKRRGKKANRTRKNRKR